MIQVAYRASSLIALALSTMVWVVALSHAAGPDEPKFGKDGDSVRLYPEQMRHIRVNNVEINGFRPQRAAIGQIAFNEDATTVVTSPFTGRVSVVIAKLGDKVERGAPLFEIDSPEVVQIQTELIAAVQALQKARGQLTNARGALNRQTDLVANKASSVRELEQAKSDYTGAESDVRTAEGNLLSARNKLRILVGRTDAEIKKVEDERVISPKFVVVAPIGGTVVAKKIGPGQYVRSDSAETLYTISDLTTMWLKASVPENEIRFVRVGQQLEVRIPALINQSFKARITAIGAMSDAQTRRVVVRSEIANSNNLLRAEMFATFQILVGEPVPSPSVPLESVIREGDIATVWVEREPMVFDRRKVQLGLEQDGVIQILKGLKTGERVVEAGAVFVDNEWRQ